MLKKILNKNSFKFLLFLSISSLYAEELEVVHSHETLKPDVIEPSDLFYEAPLKNVEFKIPKPDPSEGHVVAAVQPQVILSFEYESQWPEVVVAKILTENDWADPIYYGNRTCNVFVTFKSVPRLAVDGPKVNRKYNVQVSSDATECSKWNLYTPTEAKVTFE
ncbi:MAG: hypothetical protein R3A80_11980 [Bdellovibrionota bacterium]